MTLLNIDPMFLMAQPTGAELTFMLLMLAISVAGKVTPQAAKVLAARVHVLDNTGSKK